MKSRYRNRFCFQLTKLGQRAENERDWFRNFNFIYFPNEFDIRKTKFIFSFAYKFSLQ